MTRPPAITPHATPLPPHPHLPRRAAVLAPLRRQLVAIGPHHRHRRMVFTRSRGASRGGRRGIWRIRRVATVQPLITHPSSRMFDQHSPPFSLESDNTLTARREPSSATSVRPADPTGVLRSQSRFPQVLQVQGGGSRRRGR
jgi:hypothetical protein